MAATMAFLPTHDLDETALQQSSKQNKNACIHTRVVIDVSASRTVLADLDTGPVNMATLRGGVQCDCRHAAVSSKFSNHVVYLPSAVLVAYVHVHIDRSPK